MIHEAHGQPSSSATCARHRAHVVVDGLPAEEGQRGRFLLDHGGERARGRQRVGLGPGRIVQVDGAVGAHGQAGAQRLLARSGPSETATTSPWPRFSLIRSASSTANSS